MRSPAEVKRILEAALLASPEPLGLPELKKLFDGEIATDTLRNLLAELAEEWKGRAVELMHVASGWRFPTAAEFRPYIERLAPQTPARSRSAAASRNSATAPCRARKSPSMGARSRSAQKPLVACSSTTSRKASSSRGTTRRGGRPCFAACRRAAGLQSAGSTSIARDSCYSPTTASLLIG